MFFNCKVFGYKFKAVRFGDRIKCTIGGETFEQGKPIPLGHLDMCKHVPGNMSATCPSLTETIQDAVQAGRF